MKSPREPENNRVAVLVAEDSPTQAEQLKHQLEEHGYEVTVASNGKAALAAMPICRPAVVLSDVVMPEMDGYTLCKEIKSNENFRDIPVILLTSLSGPEDVIRGLQCGADNFIQKPYEGKTLLSRIEYILANRALRKKETLQMGVAVYLAGERHFITADRQQILDLLISTYEEAVRINSQLQQRQRELSHSLQTLQSAEEALRQANAWQQAILDHAAYALISTTPEGVIQTFNPAAEHMLGYTAKEVVGRRTPEIFHDPREVAERARVFSNELETSIEPGFEVFAAKARRNLPNEYEWTYIRKDGARLTVLLSVTALRDRDGQITGFLGIANDITERKKVEEAMRRAKEEAERTSRFKDQFLSTMSHELRTPLNAILGFSELLQDDSYGPLTKRQRRYLIHIQTGGQHLLRLINDILDLSKIEAGRLELAIESVSVRTAFSEVLSALRPLADKKSQELLLEAEDGLTVRADATRFKQVLMNLVGNAIKFTPQGGRIGLGAHRKDGRVRVEIQDTGPGIPPEEQKRIFEAFVRLQSGKGAEGTGLGLAITQRLVELHGGQLGLESETGKGSCFFFVLPEALPARQPRPKKTAAPAVANENPLILIVEDDPAAAQLITSQLASYRYDAAVCGEPQKAVEMAATLQPLAITLDILMKPMNGFAVLLQLKNDPRTKGIPVIVLTIVDQAALGTTLGAEEYLVKPVEKATLLAAIERCLGARGVQTAVRPILVVEDDAPTREIISDMLAAAGYAVVTAADGEQARAWIAATLPELVILDMVLPKVSGFELLAEWRADPRTAELPVFVLTGKDLNEIEEEYLRTHAESLFRKQQAWQSELLKQLERLVGRRPAEQP